MVVRRIIDTDYEPITLPAYHLVLITGQSRQTLQQVVPLMNLGMVFAANIRLQVKDWASQN